VPPDDLLHPGDLVVPEPVEVQLPRGAGHFYLGRTKWAYPTGSSVGSGGEIGSTMKSLSGTDSIHGSSSTPDFSYRTADPLENHYA